MNCLKFQASLRYMAVSGFILMLFTATAPSLKGDEPKSNENNGQLEERLQRISNQELRAIAEGRETPALIGVLRPSTARLNEAVMKELVRRLDAKPDKPMVDEPGVSVATGNKEPDLNPELGGDLPADKNAAELDAEPSEIKLANIGVESFAADPFSVALIELQYEPGQGPIIYPDQALFLDSTDQRAHYIAFDVLYQQRDNEPTMMVERLRAFFLLRGSDSCQVSLSTAGAALFETKDVQPIQDSGRHGEMLSEWWKHFSVIPTSYGSEQKELKESLLDILARRLQLPGPWPSIAKIEKAVNETSLEHQFERGIGMLFGIESVRLAMRVDTALNQPGSLEKANLPIPVRPVLRSVEIPPASTSTWIEPIAMHVPAECFYLRTGSFANYRQFRQFMLGWGGSLNDIVSSGSVSHQSRERIEGQLGLAPDQIKTGEIDKFIADMAIIGCDPMFDDGASVGVLFQARDSNGLAGVLKLQRNQVRLRVPESEERRVTVDGHNVSFLTSKNHSVRSFYAIAGDFHLVTNSYHLVSRFFQASVGTGSLGKLNEFRYARDQANQIGERNRQQPLAMLYLSDPFFQNLISPHYRIEMSRRQQAAQELRRCQLALLVAKAENIDAVTIDQLVDSRLLPSGFGTRPDGTYPILENGQVRDSRRGASGYFLPIPDMPLQKATQTEVNSYQQFMAQYNQEWRRVDPVTVVFSRAESDKDGFQQIGLDIIITPYAQQHYALLSQHLSNASDQRVVPLNDDLVSLDTSIQPAQGLSGSHLLYLGLRDNDLPFAFKHGQIELIDRSDRSSYAKINSYAAISPPSTDALQLLAAAFRRVQRPEDVQEIQPKRTEAALPRAGGTGGYGLLHFFVPYVILKSVDAIKYGSFVTSDSTWMVASAERSLRQDVLKEIDQEHIPSSPQVRLRVKSLANTKAEPYIQAYTYLASRKASSENSRFLNDVTSWLHLPIAESRDPVETVLGGRLRCPLGGDFGLRDSDGHSYWAGTLWPEESYFTETETPPFWKFAFLDWLRGLDLRFNINQTTLRAQIDMLVLPPVDNGGDDQWVPLKLQGNPHPTNAVAIDNNPLAANRRLQSLPSSVLGVAFQAKSQPYRISVVYPNSPASRAGLLVGDQILVIDRVTPESIDHLAKMIESAQNGSRALTVRVLREGSRIEFQIPLRKR
jgi:hypothetical protein